MPSALRVPALLRSAAAALLLASALPARAEPVALTAEDFKLYKEYQAALTDERVLKMAEDKRLPAIARNFKVSEKALREAVEKFESVGADVATKFEAEIRTALDATALKGSLDHVKVDDSTSHAVTYISWRNADAQKLEEEAALVALSVAKAAPITSTVALWALDATGRKVFEAKISASAARNFKPERLQMFASTRYIRLFEDVRNLYKGNPPEQN